MILKELRYFRQVNWVNKNSKIDSSLVETSSNHLIIEKHTEASSQVHIKGQSNNFSGYHRSSSTWITTSR